jgi:hypothetical protein
VCVCVRVCACAYGRLNPRPCACEHLLYHDLYPQPLNYIIIIIIVFWGRFSLHSPGSALKLVILWLQPSKYWNYKHTPRCLALNYFLIEKSKYGHCVQYLVGFFFFKSGLCTYKAVTLLLEPHLQPILFWLFWRRGSHKLFAWAGLKPQFSQSQPPK